MVRKLKSKPFDKELKKGLSQGGIPGVFVVSFGG